MVYNTDRNPAYLIYPPPWFSPFLFLPLQLQENSKDSEGQIDKKSEVKEEKVEPLLIDENGKEAEH